MVSLCLIALRLSHGQDPEGDPSGRTASKKTLIILGSAVPDDETADGVHPTVHPVNLSRGHGSSIHEVSGSGIVLSLPLRATQRKTPQDSQAVARSGVVFAS